MPIPTSITDLSATASSNSPQGNESATEGDNYLRAIQAIMRTEHNDFADSSATAKGDAMVGVKHTATGAQGTTQHEVNLRTLHVFDFLNSTQQADVRARTRAQDVTTAVQAAIDAAKATTNRETHLVFEAGAYAVDTLDMDGMNRVTLVCNGYVEITGMDTASDYIVSIDSIEASPTTGITVHGYLNLVANSGTAYKSALYARWMTNSELRVIASGAFSVATLDFDVCFDNDFAWLWAQNSTDGKHLIKCGSNNVNANKWRIRLSGSASTDTRIGMELTGSNNTVFGDISAIGTGLKLTSARGASIQLYTEAIGTSVTASGTSRGITFTGGTYEVKTSGTGMDFSGGTVQGLNLIGVRFKGASGGSSRKAFALGTACYFTNVIGCDYEDIDTQYTGTLRGNTGGSSEQLIGGTRHLTTGAVAFLGGVAYSFVDTTVSASGTFTPDISLGTHQYVNITTTGAVTIAAPTNASGSLDGRERIVLRIVNASGGSLSLTFAAGYKLAGSFTAPATGKNRAIVFWKEGLSWYEESRSAADIDN